MFKSLFKSLKKKLYLTFQGVYVDRETGDISVRIPHFLSQKEIDSDDHSWRTQAIENLTEYMENNEEEFRRRMKEDNPKDFADFLRKIAN